VTKRMLIAVRTALGGTRLYERAKYGDPWRPTQIVADKLLPKIEPCVCGCKVKVHVLELSSGNGYQVHCTTSGWCWCGPRRDTERAAILAWNFFVRAAKRRKG
jgi:hypothetical protein